MTAVTARQWRSASVGWWWPQAAVVGLLTAACFAVFAVDAIDAALHNRVFIGADGTWAYDQLQYLSWATDAGHHGLIANPFAFHLGSHVFLDPLWLVIGVLHVDGGLSYSLLIGFGQALALMALFVAVRSYARSLLGADELGVMVAVLLALFMLPATFVIANGLHLSGSKQTNFETLAVGWVSDDLQFALAVAAMVAFLVQIQRLLEARSVTWTSRPMWMAAGAGLAAAWLHPWQGIVVLLILGMLVVWERPALRRHLRLFAPVAITALPVGYYALLSAVDPGWAQSRHATEYRWTPYVASLLVTLLPVAVMAAPGYLMRAEEPGERMLKLWPLASIILFVASPSDAMHAFGGISIPAAVLMLRGWPQARSWLRIRSLRRARSVAAGAVVLAVLAAPLSVGQRVREHSSGDQASAEIGRDEATALDWLASRTHGVAILTTGELGGWVPALVDAHTWIGHPIWTPHYGQRERRVEALFGGSMNGEAAQAFVRSTAATYVLEPCGWHARLAPELGAIGFRAHQFGCAVVYAKAA
jgi:hypothetical protein